MTRVQALGREDSDETPEVVHVGPPQYPVYGTPLPTPVPSVPPYKNGSYNNKTYKKVEYNKVDGHVTGVPLSGVAPPPTPWTPFAPSASRSLCPYRPEIRPYSAPSSPPPTAICASEAGRLRAEEEAAAAKEEVRRLEAKNEALALRLREVMGAGRGGQEPGSTICNTTK